MVDYPLHLLQAGILKGSLLDEPGVRAAFEVSLLRPHSVFELLTAALGMALPLQLAGRLVVAGLVLANAAACLLLVRHTGRPAYYAWIGASGLFGFSYYWGLLGNLAAYPLLLVSAVLADRAGDRPLTPARWLLLAGIGAAFFFVHLLGFAVYAVILGWLSLSRRPPWRRLLTQLSPLVPGAAVAAAWLAAAPSPPPVGAPPFVDWGPGPDERLTHWASCAFGVHADGAQWLTAALLALAAVVAVAGASRGPPRQTGPATLAGRRSLGLALWMAALYLALPAALGALTFVYARVAALALPFAAAALPVPRDRRAARAALLLVGAAVLCQLAVSGRAARAYGEEVTRLHALLEQAPPGRRLLGLNHDATSQGLPYPPLLLHAQVHYEVLRGGQVAFDGTDPGQGRSSFRYRPPGYQVARRRPEHRLPDLGELANPWQATRAFDFARDGERFDGFLLRAEPSRQDLILAQTFGGRPGLAIARLGWWVLVWRT